MFYFSHVLFCDFKAHVQILRVLLLHVLETIVHIWIHLLHKLESDLKLGNGYSHSDVEVAPIGYWLSEGEGKNLANENMFFTNSDSVPPHHELSDHAPVVTALFIVELDCEGVVGQLVEGHIEWTLPS